LHKLRRLLLWGELLPITKASVFNCQLNLGTSALCRSAQLQLMYLHENRPWGHWIRGWIDSKASLCVGGI
jgi:hypothetical protein